MRGAPPAARSRPPARAARSRARRRRPRRRRAAWRGGGHSHSAKGPSGQDHGGPRRVVVGFGGSGEGAGYPGYPRVCALVGPERVERVQGRVSRTFDGSGEGTGYPKGVRLGSPGTPPTGPPETPPPLGWQPGAPPAEARGGSGHGPVGGRPRHLAPEACSEEQSRRALEQALGLCQAMPWHCAHATTSIRGAELRSHKLHHCASPTQWSMLSGRSHRLSPAPTHVQRGLRAPMPPTCTAHAHQAGKFCWSDPPRVPSARQRGRYVWHIGTIVP
jgi:hypothetical protein